MTTFDDYLAKCEAGDTDAVKSILERHPDYLNHTNEEGWSGLIYASRANRTATVRYLVEEKGAEVNPPQELKHSALRGAAMNGHSEVVRMLLDNGAKIDVRSGGARTALMGSVMNRHSEVAKLLVARGASLDIMNDFGETALDLAKKNQDEDMMKLLSS